MAVRERCSEICSFFIYDHNVLKREEDDLKDAIIYFFPHTVSIDNQCALLGKLIGISDFFTTTLPESAPKIIKFHSEKFATRKEGDFTIGLGCDLNVPDSFVSCHLDFIWGVFAFFQGSLLGVKQRSKSAASFPAELCKVWDLYLPVCQYYGDLMSQAFQVIPDIQLPKSCCKTFLHASHILQRSHRQNGVLGGVVLYKSKVLCTQFSPDVTKRFLLLKPQQSHLPCHEIKTDFELPGGMRLIKVYLSKEEYKRLSSRRNHSLKTKRADQLLDFDTSDGLSTELATLQTLDCQDGFSVGQTILKSDAHDHFDNMRTKIESHSRIELDETGSPNGEMSQTGRESRVVTFGAKGETTLIVSGEVTPNDSGAKMDKSDVVDSAKASENIKVVEGDVRWVNGIRKSFSENENNSSAENTNTEVLDSKGQSETEVKSEQIVEDVESVALKKSEREEELLSDEGTEVDPKVHLYSDAEKESVPNSETEILEDTPKNYSDSPSTSTKNSSDSPSTSTNNEKENLKENEQILTETSEKTERNSSTSPNNVTSGEYSPDEVSSSQSSRTPSDKAEVKSDSEIVKSHDDKQFAQSSATMSSVSDDVLSSHKETLDFSEDHALQKSEDTKFGWAVTQSLERVKEGNFMSSESYVSSSYSHSESEQSESWTPEHDDMVDLTMYVQGHSEMLLILLLDNGVRCDKALVTELWKCSLAHLAELDFEVKESLESASRDQFGSNNYFFLQYDSFTRNVSGNVLESVTGAAHEFVTTAATMHDTFMTTDTLSDMLLRSHSSSVYGHRSVCHETFFQLNVPQKHIGGYPQVKDVAFTLDQIATQKLRTNHDITLL